MTEFEDQLRRALERKQPSAGFTARVVTQAFAMNNKRSWLTAWRSWPAAAVAASLLLGGLGFELERRERVRQGEAARAQLLQAMEITSTKLTKIQKRVQETWR